MYVCMYVYVIYVWIFLAHLPPLQHLRQDLCQNMGCEGVRERLSIWWQDVPQKLGEHAKCPYHLVISQAGNSQFIHDHIKIGDFP